MIEFGNTLRAAREAKGLTVAQLAEATRILPRIVEDLEREDFSRLPAPIYGRGFVKLYCEQVGLDPKPMIAEFMDILNGTRDTVIKKRPVAAPAAPAAATPPPAPAPIPTPVAAEPEPPPPPRPAAGNDGDDLFTAAESLDPVSTLTKCHDASTAPEPAPAAPAPAEPKLSRYATSYDNFAGDEPGAHWIASPSIWRWAIVGVVAIVFLVLVFLGLRALYRATSPEPAPIDETTVAALGESSKTEPAAPAPDEKAKLANADRTPMDIPPLYVD